MISRALLMLLASCASQPGWATVEAQRDSRGFERASFDGQAEAGGVGLWGFVDIDREHGEASHFARFQVFRGLWRGVGPALEAQDSGDRSLKAGLGWTLPVETVFARVVVFPAVSGGDEQVRMVGDYRLGAGWSTGGFWDFNRGGHHVGEVQLRYALSPGTELFAEVKRNEYRPADRTGVGIGVRLSW